MKKTGLFVLALAGVFEGERITVCARFKCECEEYQGLFVLVGALEGEQITCVLARVSLSMCSLLFSLLHCLLFFSSTHSHHSRFSL